MHVELLVILRVFVQDHCKSGEALLKRLERWEDLSSAELQVYGVKVRSFWVHLHQFSQRVEDTKEKIDKTVRLYEFFDKVRRRFWQFFFRSFSEPIKKTRPHGMDWIIKRWKCFNCQANSEFEENRNVNLNMNVILEVASKDIWTTFGIFGQV